MSWRLYADVGNTALKWAAHDGEGWLADGRVALTQLGTHTLAEELLASGLRPEACDGAALVISRPSAAEDALAAVAGATGVKAAVLGEELQCEIATEYYDPSEIGRDRLAACEGALALHGAPAIVLTLGTCLTAQALDATGTLVGGVIAAGLQAQVAGITRLVPHLAEPVDKALANLQAGGELPEAGRSTVENLVLGLVSALRGGVAEMTGRMAEVLGGEVPTIATGGDLSLAQSMGVAFDYVEPLLVLEGLRAVDERLRGR